MGVMQKEGKKGTPLTDGMSTLGVGQELPTVKWEGDWWMVVKHLRRERKNDKEAESFQSALKKGPKRGEEMYGPNFTSGGSWVEGENVEKGKNGGRGKPSHYLVKGFAREKSQLSKER